LAPVRKSRAGTPAAKDSSSGPGVGRTVAQAGRISSNHRVKKNVLRIAFFIIGDHQLKLFAPMTLFQ